MAVVYAPKTDLVGRGVVGGEPEVQRGLLRTALTADGLLVVEGEPRIGQLLADLTGDSAVTAATPTADTSAATTLDGQGDLTSQPPASSFRADLTGDLTLVSEPVRAHLTGTGAVQATITGGQGVAIVALDLSGSGTLSATSAPITHEVSVDLTGSAHLGVRGANTEVIEDPVDLLGEGVLAADATYLPDLTPPAADLTGQGGLYAMLRDDIAAAAGFIANGVLSDRTFALVPVADQSVEEGDSVSLDVVSRRGFSPVTLSVDTLPSGVTLADNGDGTGTIGGTLDAGTAGSYTTTVTATDDLGREATDVIEWTVANPANPGPYNVALVVNNAGHGATTNTTAALEAHGHTVTVFLDTAYATNDFSGQDIIVVCRGVGSQAMADDLITEWEAGTPVVWGSTNGVTVGTGRTIAPTLADLTGTFEVIDDGEGETELDIIANPNPSITANLLLGRLEFYDAGNWMYALDSGAAFVGTALADGDPDNALAGQHVLIAIEEGTERLNAAGPTPTNSVVLSDLYGGQSAYTTAGAELLHRCLQWCHGVDLTVALDPPQVAAAEAAALLAPEAAQADAVEAATLIPFSDTPQADAVEVAVLIDNP